MSSPELHPWVSFYPPISHAFVDLPAFEYTQFCKCLVYCTLLSPRAQLTLLFLLAPLGALGQLTFTRLNLSPTGYKSLEVSAVILFPWKLKSDCQKSLAPFQNLAGWKQIRKQREYFQLFVKSTAFLYWKLLH